MQLGINFIIGVIYLDWDQGEPLYLYNFKTLVCKKREMHVKASKKFQNFFEHQKRIFTISVLSLYHKFMFNQLVRIIDFIYKIVSSKSVYMIRVCFR
jgi:hypothetical protein